MTGRLSWTLIPAALALCLLVCASVQAQDAQQRRGFSISITEPENQALVFRSAGTDVEMGFCISDESLDDARSLSDSLFPS